MKRRIVAFLMSMMLGITCVQPGTLLKPVQVQASKKKVKLNRKKVTLKIGEKIKLKLKNAKAKKVKWKSSNKKIATVKKGVVKAKRPGKVKITAKYKKKKYKATVNIKVKNSYCLNGLKRATLMLDGLDEGKNIIVSPTSLNIVLGMVANAADDKGKTEIEKYLGKNIDSINKKFNNLMTRSLNDKMLNLNNCVWYKNGKTINNTYKNVLEKNYFSEFKNIDMKAEDADIINKWVADKTENMIKKIVDEKDISSLDLRAIIINALMFNGEWTEKIEGPNRKEDFTKFSGDKYKAEMMISSERTYYENKYATAFEKTYGDDKEYSFIGILPKKKGKFKMADLELESLINSKTNEYKVDITLPRFESDWNKNLNDMLRNNGINQIFNFKTNALPNLFEKSIESMYISDVIQSCNIKVDNNGTKAAAVTVAYVKCTSMAFVKRKTVELNRPFAYMIVDNKTKDILFIGKYLGK